MKKLLSILLVLALLLGMLPVLATALEGETVDFVVLSTTDMHGKCWDKNVLTDGNENNTMLRVSTAVSQLRETYGENMLLIDNGDLYQGTPVSTVQLGKITSGESDLPAAMALCLGDIGYDVSVLGNHEFNYPWTTMSGIYAYLATRGVPVITANLYYDGTDGVHEPGENVFTPYLVKTVDVLGTEHKIGVLGFENTDCTRWDVPDNYPGILFSHPDNPERSIAWEAQRYIPMMQAEGCEFIIVSYHSGLGSTSGELVFTQNSEGQVARMIAECEGIDMVIAGHDHSNAYSNTYLQDKNGKDVLVVNGGGTQLTQSVFSFYNDADGKLHYTVKETKNLGLSAYAVDTTLKEKLQPYADMAIEYVNQTAGTAVGEWDTSHNYYLEQTDTIDLINEVQKTYGSKYMAKKYDTEEKKNALYAATGLDHIDVDVSAASPVTNNNYYVKPGVITMKTIVQMYKYDNNVLYLLPLTGQQIKDILEQNAATRLKASVKNGAVTYSTMGDNFTNVVFGGLNFTYDMYQPEGSRVIIDGLANGRGFALDQTYIVACNSYHLGNAGCGFGNYTTTDSIWNQNDDLGGSNIQEAILEYIQDLGEISTAPFTWTWRLDYSGNLDAPTELSGAFAAQLVTDPALLENGDRIVIYYNADSTVIGHEKAADDRRLDAVDTVAVGDYISASDAAAIFEIEWIEGTDGRFRLKAEQGYLTAGTTGNSLGFSESYDPEAGPNDCTAWYLTPVDGGYHIMSVGANYNGNHNQAIEWYSGFTTYGVKDTAIYLFNLYKVADTAKRVEALTDGRQYAIYFNDENLTVSDQAKSGGLDGVTNTVSGDFLMLPAAEHTLLVFANIDEGDRIDFVTADGKHLTSNPTGNGVKLTDELAENDCSLWTLVPVEGGFHVMNVGANYNGNYNQALEYYSGKFTTYGVSNTGAYLFNFYELAEPVGEGILNCTFPSVENGDIDKYGDVHFSITSGELAAAGFEYADLVKLTFLDQEVIVPIIPQYRYVGAKCAGLVMWEDETKAAEVEIFNGSFAETYGLATKTVNEDKTWYYTPNEGVEFPVAVTIQLYEKGGYADTYAIFDLTRSNVREDYTGSTEPYPALTDEEFANFRVIATTGMGEGKLYRSSSPINPAIGRSSYADAASEAAGVKSFVNLADSSDTAGKYEGYGNTYYCEQNILFLNLGVDFTTELNRAGLVEAMDFLKDCPTPVLVHCNEGQDRAGFVSALLECLMGASYEEVVADYMVTFYNYYGVQEGTDQYNQISNNVIKNLSTAFGISTADLATADLAAEAEAYFLELGVSQETIDAVKVNLGGGAPFLFDDVQDPSKFYYEPVYWAFFHDPQITTGTSETTFGPGKTCNRGAVVTFLWRAMGCPEPTITEHPFTDVKETAYYYKAMLWAVETGITTGTSETTFGPGKEATRGQVVTFLWRALGEPQPTNTDHPFTDVKETGYYYTAMLWAVETGVTSGSSATTFSPGKTATRGHVVTFLFRACAE